jgi:restriction system protein
MKGWIFGSSQQKTWTQKIYQHTTAFQNPLHPNYKHTQTLQSILGLEADKVFSLVVFVDDSDFKTPLPYNVVYTGGYIRYIKNKKQPILTNSEIWDIWDKIESGQLKSSIKTHRDH